MTILINIPPHNAILENGSWHLSDEIKNWFLENVSAIHSEVDNCATWYCVPNPKNYDQLSVIRVEFDESKSDLALCFKLAFGGEL